MRSSEGNREKKPFFSICFIFLSITKYQLSSPIKKKPWARFLVLNTLRRPYFFRLDFFFWKSEKEGGDRWCGWSSSVKVKQKGPTKGTTRCRLVALVVVRVHTMHVHSHNDRCEMDTTSFIGCGNVYLKVAAVTRGCLSLSFRIITSQFSSLLVLITLTISQSCLFLCCPSHLNILFELILKQKNTVNCILVEFIVI